MTDNLQQHRVAVQEHVLAHFSYADVVEYSWEQPPMPEVLPHWRCYAVGPVGPAQRSAYVTAGAWEAQPRVEAGVAHEFILHSPVQTEEHVELLAWVSTYSLEARFDVRYGTTLAVGRPWLPGSACDHLLVGRPYSYPDEFEYLSLDGLVVHFLWLVPITRAEAEWCGEHGRERFEDLLEESDAEITDPGRPSLVQAQR